MTNDQYAQHQHMLLTIRATLETLDLDAFLTTLGKAEAAGAVIDPTTYREAMPRLEFIRQVASRLKDVKAIPLPAGVEVVRPGRGPSDG